MKPELEKLLFVDDIMERYHVSRETARDYMRRMEHMEKPLCTTEAALAAWEASRMRPGGRADRDERPAISVLHAMDTERRGRKAATQEESFMGAVMAGRKTQRAKAAAAI